MSHFLWRLWGRVRLQVGDQQSGYIQAAALAPALGSSLPSAGTGGRKGQGGADFSFELGLMVSGGARVAFARILLSCRRESSGVLVAFAFEHAREWTLPAFSTCYLMVVFVLFLAELSSVSHLRSINPESGHAPFYRACVSGWGYIKVRIICTGLSWWDC